MWSYREYLSEASKLDATKKDVDAALALARSKGIRVPAVTYETASKNTRNSAMYSPSNDLLWINPKHWGTVPNVGWLSTQHKWGPVFHELGHCAHHDAVGSRFDNIKNHWFPPDQKQAIATEVSRYAASNAIEFVAEVFAAHHLNNKTYSDLIMRLYSMVGGPKLT